ncbi:response regulator [Myxococcota bacterium]|nr:response regulator [Myxococcota bacterium]
MKLSVIVIADPQKSSAERLHCQCEHLADECLIATTGAETLELVKTRQPDMVVVALDMENPSGLEVISTLLKAKNKPFLIVSYRELEVSTLRKLDKQGVADVISQPIDPTLLYRAASHHFGRPFRQHNRHESSIDVYRADGVVIGRAIDLSIGGLQMRANHPISTQESVLVDLELDDGKSERLRVRAHILAVDGEAPMPVIARLKFNNLRGKEEKRLLEFIKGLKLLHIPDKLV